jgi:rhomboid protease GluP
MSQTEQQKRVSTLLYQIAQSLIVHDDFTIVPQTFEEGQAPFEEDEVWPVVLYRRQWNTMQVIRLVPAERQDLALIEAHLHAEVGALKEAKRQNAVQNMYGINFWFFPSWRSDDSLKAIGEAGVYKAVTRSRGAIAIGVDMARGVLGPAKQGPALKDITLQPIAELVERFPEEEYPQELLDRSREEWNAYLGTLAERRTERMQKVFQPERKVRGVGWMIALTVLVWLIVTAYPEPMLLFGVLDAESVRRGEVWRLITSTFMHYQFTHILFNMFGVYIFGRFVERIFGLGRFLTVYLVSGVSGALLSFALNDAPSLGASTAVFGLFGALLAFGQFDRRAFAMTIGMSVYALLIINLVSGFLTPYVDNWGHIGGLVGGYLLAMVVGVPGYDNKKRGLYAAGWAVYALATFLIGMNR